MKTKTTVRYHLIPIRMATIKRNTNNKCWRGQLLTVGGNANCYSHCGKQYGGFSKKTKNMGLPYWSGGLEFPDNTGDMDSIPGPERSHMPQAIQPTSHNY